MHVTPRVPAGRNWLRGIFALAVGTAALGPTGWADCLCGTAADGLAAERAGLELEWLVQIPFNAATYSVQHVVIDRDLVVVQTGDGNVVAVQAGEGRDGTPLPGTILWKHPIDVHAGPFQPAAIGAGLVAVSHGDGIHAFDRTTGQTLWSSHLGHLADTGAAVSDGWVYAPFCESKIMRLPTNPYRKPEAVAAPVADAKKEPPAAKKQGARKKGRVGPQKVESLEPLVLRSDGVVSLQPQPFQDGVLWCTDDGTLVVLDPSGDGWRRNEFFLDRPPAGRPLVHEGAIFAATADGDLVRIDSLEEAAAGDLRLTWRVFLDARPTGPLFATGEQLVVPLGDEGLAVYSTKTGELLGRTHVCGRVVAVAAGRIWLVDALGRLASIDLATGEVRDRFCLGGFTFPVMNQATDRLILASPSGAVVSLKAHEAK